MEALQPLGIIILLVVIFTVLMPFAVWRIRREAILMNKNMDKLLAFWQK